MPDPIPANPRMAKVTRFLRLLYSRFIWLLVLAPILGVSAYSLFWVARHFGVPPYIAIFMSTCFDGAALVGADYSLKYAQAGLSGGTPRTFVRVLALVSAFLQTFHAKLDNQPPGAWVMWAALPIIAVVLYDIHIRFERRKALARVGSIYPAPLPQWGFASWILFPLRTYSELRDIVQARREALKAAAQTVIEEFRREAIRVRNVREPIPAAPPEPDREREADVAAPDVLEKHRERRQQKPRAPRDGSWAKRHSPEIHIREWALEQSAYRSRVGRRGRLPADITEAYYTAFPDERPA